MSIKVNLNFFLFNDFIEINDIERIINYKVENKKLDFI